MEQHMEKEGLTFRDVIKWIFRGIICIVLIYVFINFIIIFW